MLGTILIIVLILLLIGALPSWPYSSGWGYGPSGLLGTVLVVLLILVLAGPSSDGPVSGPTGPSAISPKRRSPADALRRGEEKRSASSSSAMPRRGCTSTCVSNWTACTNRGR